MLSKERSKPIINQIADYAFYLALTIELILVILDKSIYIIQYDGQWFRLTFALFLLKVLLTKCNTKEWLVIGTFTILGVISYLVTGRNEILRLVVMIAAFKDVNADRVIKYAFYVTLAGCVILIILSFFGIGTFSITGGFGRGEITTRYCLGMGHPNGLHCMYWALSILFIYAYRERIKWYIVACVMAGSMGLFILTDSRAGLLTSLFSTLLYFVLRIKVSEKTEKRLLYAMYTGVILVFIASFLMMCDQLFWYHLRWLDNLVTGRLVWTHMGVSQAKANYWLPFSASGRDLETDLGMVKMVYWYGYVPTVIFLIACCFLVKTAMEQGDKMVFLVVASIIVYTVFEGHEVSHFLGRNYIFFLLGKYWIEMFRPNNGKEYWAFDLFRAKGVIRKENV
jgi:hypothetical protein